MFPSVPHTNFGVGAPIKVKAEAGTSVKENVKQEINVIRIDIF